MPVNQQQIEYLNAMGIPVWISRDLPLPDDLAASADQVASVSETRQYSEASGDQLAQQVSVSSGTKKGLQAANDLIQDLQSTASSKIAEIAASIDDDPVVQAPAPIVPRGDIDVLGWAELQQSVAACQACNLHIQRKHTVFGRGNTQAQWLIVGDIPRLEDEWEQQPFTGESGELLKAMLQSMGLDSQLVYFTNLLKCRPPIDRSPEPDQASSCLSYLQRQIQLLQPELIVLMGRDTVQQVLGSSEPMARLRQQLHRREGIEAPMVATYHPAYLLRQPRLKSLAWQDLQFAKKAMQ